MFQNIKLLNFWKYSLLRCFVASSVIFMVSSFSLNYFLSTKDFKVLSHCYIFFWLLLRVLSQNLSMCSISKTEKNFSLANHLSKNPWPRFPVSRSSSIMRLFQVYLWPLCILLRKFYDLPSYLFVFEYFVFFVSKIKTEMYTSQ